MRLNLGCDNKHINGWVNVDRVAARNPDQLWNLEEFPWPWPDSSADEVLLSHVLEHLGATTEVYLELMRELYRVCRGGAKITLAVPHPRHDIFLADPTHVRPITPTGLEMFSQRHNLNWIKAGAANTPLGVYMGVDFDIESVVSVLAEPWRSQLERRMISKEAVQQAAAQYNNVVEQFTIVLRAVKPATADRRKPEQNTAPAVTG